MDIYVVRFDPKVEWFETVEKPSLPDILGQARPSVMESKGINDALDRIKTMRRPDGSLAFPEDQYDFETGDMTSPRSS